MTQAASKNYGLFQAVHEVCKFQFNVLVHSNHPPIDLAPHEVIPVVNDWLKPHGLGIDTVFCADATTMGLSVTGPNAPQLVEMKGAFVPAPCVAVDSDETAPESGRRSHAILPYIAHDCREAGLAMTFKRLSINGSGEQLTVERQATPPVIRKTL